ncbi:MAG: SAM-dependent methyltransferase, partial [Deltaproteobacteria bacterium]|nr:SAM-dependent methyltransferase [Deltaproteobacteria bacterium]
MGAYYTKEDITEYISKNTIIPFLFDQAQKKCKIAFEGEQSIWRLLKEDPDRYIYDAVKHGINVNIHETPPNQLDKTLPLPSKVSEGLNHVSKRTEWNKPAPPEYALPTEIWREVVARRQRCEEVRDKLSKGEIRSINDLITYNLDIRQFAQDVIENCEGPELLRAIYYTIAGRVPDKSNQEFQPGMSVLDPTCGSGAFLFAALNILEPLYEACLDRMQVFLDELESSGQKHRSDKYGDFRKILERIEKHPNRRYFILKSIILNNLFGVDIMEEATEICKLRLFLKLVAQVDSVDKIEPLPDIDFNIRAGNTLVGFAIRDEVKEAITSSEAGKLKQGKLQFGEYVETLKQLEEKAHGVEQLFNLFREQQTELGGVVTSSDKQALINRLKELEDDLDRYLAFEYGINQRNISDVKEYEKRFVQWRESHQPFHWFIEFYGIMKEGGFDVIIGNPPYVEYGKIKNDYVLPIG